MTCSEARQYIFAFLDNELDSALSLEVQQHIEHCPVCARECEIESVVRRRLAGRLQEADAVPAFDDSAVLRLIRTQTAEPVSAPRPDKRSWTVAAVGVIAAAASVLIFASTMFVANQGSDANYLTLADALVDDFDHFVTESKPLQIVSADAQEVSRWLEDRTALVVRVPAVDSAIATLQGGRKCKIDGRPAAFAVYRVGGDPVSVVAMRGSEQALASMKRIDRDGHTHWVDRCRGHTVLACKRGDLIYAVVSRLPEESILPLMPPVG